MRLGLRRANCSEAQYCRRCDCPRTGARLFQSSAFPSTFGASSSSVAWHGCRTDKGYHRWNSEIGCDVRPKSQRWNVEATPSVWGAYSAELKVILHLGETTHEI